MTDPQSHDKNQLKQTDNEQTPHDDGSFFSDGAGYEQPPAELPKNTNQEIEVLPNDKP